MNFPTRKPEPLPEATPVAYTVVRSSQLCSHCGTLHESSQIMVRCTMPPRYGMGTNTVVQMKALVGAPEWNLPIEHKAMETKRIPFCHECLGLRDGGSIVDTLPLPPRLDTRTLRLSADGQPLTETKASEASGTARSPKKPSTDDLLDLI